MSSWIQTKVRWSARLTGAALLALMGVFVIAHGGFPSVLDQPLPVQVEFAGMLLMLTGLVGAWRWEMIGGLAMIAGFAVFLVTELLVNAGLPGGALPLFVIPGILFVTSGVMAKATHHAVPA